MTSKLGSLLGLILLSVGSIVAKGATPVILSTDIGNEIDDQWAIAYLMLDPNFKVLGLISAHAPSIPDPAGYNSYVLLRDEVENQLNMSSHPPILAGGDKPLENKKTPRVNDAVHFLIDQSKGYSRSNRLTIIGIGATTDIASAILADPSIIDRIRVVAMAFADQEDAKEFNVQNDVAAWQALLDSNVPLVVGSGNVCRRDLAMHFNQANEMLAKDGPIGAWLWDEYKAWYYRQVKPLRTDDFTKPWMIWDIITIAYLEGMATAEAKPRPVLNDDFTLGHPETDRTVIWITSVDSSHLWSNFQATIHAYLITHAVSYRH